MRVSTELKSTFFDLTDERFLTSHVAHYYSPETSWPRLESPALVQLPLHYSFDFKRAQEELQRLSQRQNFHSILLSKEGQQETGYSGIGFKHRQGAQDQSRDAVMVYDDKGGFHSSGKIPFSRNSPMERKKSFRFERDFTEWGDHFRDTYFSEMMAPFQSLITKLRLLRLDPGKVVTPHWDFPYYEQIRVHAVLESNTECWWRVEDQTFQMPADGNFYFFDTGKVHALANFGDTPRTVLIAHLSVYKNQEDQLVYQPQDDLVSLIRSARI